ncbi:hypothetical protein AN958_01266 [Leucoagaricus sp. SymC.cos]|nr:hypothetical protein AN958_01266 [Leucoagaricus sp. SymC.cos]
MRSIRITPLSYHIELPVSRKVDHEILKYLVDELTKIGEERVLPDSWLTEKATAILVELSAGLFIYAVTVILFIGDRNSTSLVDRLNEVLSLKAPHVKKDAEHPLSALDLFYILIPQTIPSKVLPTTLKILLLHSTSLGANPDITGRPGQLNTCKYS